MKQSRACQIVIFHFKNLPIFIIFNLYSDLIFPASAATFAMKILCYNIGMAIAIKMPKLSPTMESGVLSGWLVKVGDNVKPGAVIAEIETDKAVMEVEALVKGVVGYLSPIEGLETPVNAVIGFILAEGESAPDSWEDLLKANSSSEPKISQPNVVTEIVKEKIVEISKSDSERVFASPLAKKIAKNFGLDLSDLTFGSGPRGRIIKDDVENHLHGMGAGQNIGLNGVKTPQNRSSCEIPMSGMRKIIAQRLSQAKQEIPHIYMQKRVYMDAVEDIKSSFLSKFGTKISLTPFFIKAVAMALRENEVLNRTFENGKILQHNDYNIGIAIAVDGGIMVPVVKNADRKNLLEIYSEMTELANLAKEGRLKPEHSAGGTFSISNLGMFGIDSFQAIVNPPQVAILAVAASFVEAFFDGEKFIPKKVVKCEVSCDHRVVDGADAAKFLQSFAKYMENPEGMLL